MGVGLGTALLIGAGIGTAGAVAGSAISSKGAQSVNEDVMSFNAEQADKARSYQTMMYERQKLDQENFYKQYQSPEAISKSLAGLGVNPSSVFSSGQSIGGSASSMPSVPSGAQASIGSLLNPLAPYAEGLQGVTGQAAQMLSAMSDSKLKDAQTVHVLKQAYGQEFTNQLLKISASVANWQIPQEAKAKIDDLMASAALKNAHGKYLEAQTETERIFKIVRENEVKIGHQNILDMSIRLSYLDSLLNNQLQLGKEQIKTEKTVQGVNRSQTNVNLSVYRLNNAMRETENQLRDGKVELQQLGIEQSRIGRDMMYNDLFVSNRSLLDRTHAMVSEYQRQGILTKQEAERLYQLEVSSDWAERREFINYVGATAQAVGNVLGGTGSVMSGAANWKNAKWNNLNYQQKNQITREIGSERNRILDEYQRQSSSTHRSAVLGPDWEMYSDQWAR